MSLSADVPLTAPQSEKRLAALLEHRFFLRLHMTAILTSTILVGLATTRLLFMMHINIFAIRYGVAVIAAYAAFVGFVKLWLIYITARGGSSLVDSMNFSGGGFSSGESSSGSSSSSTFGSGGGKFGGGGSSGSWEEGSGSSSKAAVAAVPLATQPGTTKTKSLSSSKSSSSGSSDDLGDLMLIVLIVALVVATVVSFLWLVWAAPGILSETAFNAALAGVLTHHAHRASNGNWVGSVLKKTAIPFALVLILSIAMGAWAQHYCPSAVRLRDALPCVK